jgi:hypothetical protein
MIQGINGLKEAGKSARLVVIEYGNTDDASTRASDDNDFPRMDLFNRLINAHSLAPFSDTQNVLISSFDNMQAESMNRKSSC